VGFIDGEPLPRSCELAFGLREQSAEVCWACRWHRRIRGIRSKIGELALGRFDGCMQLRALVCQLLHRLVGGTSGARGDGCCCGGLGCRYLQERCRPRSSRHPWQSPRALELHFSSRSSSLAISSIGSRR
jgi:hypothetical protein